MKYLILLPLLLIFSNTFSQKKSIKKDKWHWNNNKMKQDTTAGYCQVLKVDNILYISGAVTTDLSPKGIQAVYNDLKASLASFGATFQHVVKENLYTTDIESMKKYNDVRKKFYTNDFPAATWIQVQRLYISDAKLEVELIAHLPN
ncbi:RidA family protein [Sphingobacterium siyangense]|uniref:RidA family protein n=1 Tax=Sphingobacterium siyangense TaxID=459529 RepID=UPI00301B38D5